MGFSPQILHLLQVTKLSEPQFMSGCFLKVLHVNNGGVEVNARCQMDGH